jgi:NAD(P)-dependent dehydrogenase (short-subunit alcohol dehydrogenase family)
MASVLITGTSKGIGYETALAFARSGYLVHATMRNPSQAPLLGEMAAHEKLSIEVSAMDVDSDESVSRSIESIRAKHGPIDVLVNNAGIERAGSIEESPMDDFRATMETNYFGSIRCIKGVISDMRLRRLGAIINVSSVAGSFSQPPMTAYCASKWALEAMTESLACEMKSFGVRVAMVKPGIIDTSMAHRIKDVGISAYPHSNRISAWFEMTLKNAPVPPSLVADKIVEVVQSGTWELRHLVGPDALPIITLRKGMTDEQWIDLHSADDETYNKFMSAGAGD